MAERRMFAKTIIDSDAFLDMPLTTQALYFHLSMRADDEGFINNPKKIMRMIGASDDEMRLLVAKSFIIPFESGVCVIKHWRIHNYLRSDRFKPTVYIEEKNQLAVKDNKAYTKRQFPVTSGIPLGIPEAYQVDTQDRLGKDRLGKDRLGKDRLGEDRLGKDRLGEDSIDEEPAAELPAPPRQSIPYEAVRGSYNEICRSLSKCTKMSEARKKSIKARFANGYTLDDFKAVFSKAEASGFLKGCNDRNWKASFDWLISDKNMAKVLDGNYDDFRPDPQPTQPQRSSNPFLQMLREEEARNGQK